MSKATICVVVPVYKAMATLDRCVESVLAQQVDGGLACILVDDGSPDESGAMCDAWAAKDDRVTVIHQDDLGVSGARNSGVAAADSEFIVFLDSDDALRPGALQAALTAQRAAPQDFVVWHYTTDEHDPAAVTADAALRPQAGLARLWLDCLLAMPWNKLYRRDIVEEHNLRMDTDINWCEDFMFNLEYIRYAKVFYALHAPIYYYVKRKGSLASQGINISKTVKMKLNVFEYYNNFYKHVLEEEDYEKNRLQVYRFFIDAAGDGTVPPSILPGSKKLGDERVFVNTEILQAEGPAGEDYRKRKLLEHYLEPVALKGDLKVMDVRLLLCLCEKHEWDSRRELADFAGITRTNLTSGLQRLTMKGFLKVEEVKEPKPSKKDKTTGKNKMKTAEMAETKRKERGGRIAVTILPAADAVMKELEMAQRDYDAARFAGFTEEELIKYADLSEKIKENTKNILYFLN